MAIQPEPTLPTDSGYVRTKWMLFVLIVGWFPFGMLIQWVIPLVFQSYIPGFILMGAYALLGFIILFKALLHQCPGCGRLMGVVGLFSKTCRWCRRNRRYISLEAEADGPPHDIPNASNSWCEYYRLKRSLLLVAMITAPLCLGASMLLPLVGISSRQYSPLILVALLAFYAVIGRRYFWYPCPTCKRGYAGAQLYRNTCPHCGTAIGYSNGKEVDVNHELERSGPRNRSR